MKNVTKMTVLLAVACLMISATTAGAGVIVRYGFGDESGSATTSPDAGYPIDNVSATSANGSGSGRGDTSDEPYDDGNTRSIYWDNTDNGSTSFTLTPDDTYAINVSKIIFKIDSEATNPTWYVQSSLTTGDLDTGDVTTSIDNNGTWSLAEVDLSEVADLQNVDSAVTFTLGWTGESSSSQQQTRLDKIQVEGTVVPEPATLALLGLGGLGMALRRRRR